ncbi:MAG: hypothetical protein AB4352_14630 [Hormoscilla sp.]
MSKVCIAVHRSDGDGNANAIASLIVTNLDKMLLNTNTIAEMPIAL